MKMIIIKNCMKNFYRNTKSTKKHWKIIAGILILVLAGVYLYNPVLRHRNHELSAAIQTLSYKSGATLEEVMPFEWDYVYRFTPYTPKEDMEYTMGVASRYVTEAKQDNIMQVYVVKDGKIVAFVKEKSNSNIEAKIPEVVKNETNEKSK